MDVKYQVYSVAVATYTDQSWPDDLYTQMYIHPYRHIPEYAGGVLKPSREHVSKQNLRL